MKTFSILSTTLFLFLVIISSHAQTTATFTNGGGDGKWTNPDNWDTGEVPDVNNTAVIPEGFNVEGPGWGEGGIEVNNLQNSGNLNLLTTTHINTNTLNNSGSINASGLSASGIGGNEISITNTGEILSFQYVAFNNVSQLFNAGEIGAESFRVDDCGNFLNQENGHIRTARGGYQSYTGQSNIEINCKSLISNGEITSLHDEVKINATNNVNHYGTISGYGSVSITTRKCYLKMNAGSKTTAPAGKVTLSCRKGVLNGSIISGYYQDAPGASNGMKSNWFLS